MAAIGGCDFNVSFSQKLVPSLDGKRVLAKEVLVGSPL